MATSWRKNWCKVWGSSHHCCSCNSDFAIVTSGTVQVTTVATTVALATVVHSGGCLATVNHYCKPCNSDSSDHPHKLQPANEDY